MSRRRTRALPARFFAQPAEGVARALLGTLLVSTIDGQTTAGRIVETEAYVGPHDPASHAAERIGRTPRNEPMFGHPGIAYVYRIYGVHWCLNTVTDEAAFPAAVLIRALEPLRGLDVMRARRARDGRTPPDRHLASGPGRLAAALGITGALNGHPLDRAPLWIEPGTDVADADVSAGPRIGITRAAEWPLRFCVRGSAWLSRT
ncbi:MAG TPA: DNA-3-methyladenine glycosylase [Longimicrobiales bacterium]|nr:DNA-3-methyladenine glycosylase [Longimicrobiales bacterium]